jgi:hypothetical protein
MTIEALTTTELEQALAEVTCPACGQPAEVRDRRILGSTNGPVEHVKTRCEAGHVLTQIVERDGPPL